MFFRPQIIEALDFQIISFFTYLQSINLWQALDFNLDVKHPQSYVHTLIADYKRLTSEMVDSSTGVRDTIKVDATIPSVQLLATEDTADTAGNFSIVNAESVARKEWSVAAESALIALQLSKAALLYSPLIIAVAAMKQTEPVGELVVKFDAYVLKRFGLTGSVLLKHYGELEAMMKFAKEPIDLVFLKAVCMERLKKESVWSKAKVKKPKVSLAEAPKISAEILEIDNVKIDAS